MLSKIDITGKRYGRLLVSGESHKVASRVYWECLCDCGNIKKVWGADLKRGMTRSCGCLKRDLAGESSKTHGMHKHPAYCSWKMLKQRCLNPNDEGYKIYGGRGISVCAEWLDFNAFWRDMGHSWQPGMSIDRIDTDGDYEPGNCKWSTPKEQGNNRRTNVMVDGPNGERMTITQASEHYGVDRRAVYARIRYGWPESEWFKPARKSKPRIKK